MKQDKKIPVTRIISNYGYILRYIFKKDPWLMIVTCASYVFCGVGYACMDTIFLRTFINFLYDKDRSFQNMAALIIGVTVVMAFLMALQRSIESFARPRVYRLTGRMQEEMMRKVSAMDMICYDCDAYYDDFVVAASQLEEAASTAMSDLMEMLRDVIAVLVLSSLITSINPVIAVFPVLGFIINMISRFRIMKLEYELDVEKKTIMRRSDYSKRVFYQPEYAKEIKLSHIEVPLQEQFDQAVDEALAVSKKYGVRIALWSLVNWIMVFTVLSMFCVPLYLGWLALVRCSILLGDVAALNNAQSTVRNRLDAINYCVERIQKNGLFVERFRKFMDYESSIEGAKGSVGILPKQGSIEIKDMSYRYEKADHDTLKHINMTIRPGEKVAFVGENGAGKSTLVKLLMRLYDVTEGSISYGGHDIREYATARYRDIFGTVFQDYQLYAANVRDNVRMDGSGADDQQIKDALDKAGFAKRLAGLSKGLDTSLTREFDDEGVQLSGGEAQKVAIARLFAKKERMHIAILDEPSSALDPKAEYELNRNILDKAQEATVIFISHRLSTTKDADRIYMFENGGIVEQGTHDELMRLDGRYARMFRCQAKYYQDNYVRMDG